MQYPVVTGTGPTWNPTKFNVNWGWRNPADTGTIQNNIYGTATRGELFNLFTTCAVRLHVEDAGYQLSSGWSQYTPWLELTGAISVD